MKLGSIGRAQICCSPFLLAALPFFVVFGLHRALFLSILSLILHECAHSMSAHSLGYGVERITLHPFGFSANLAGRVRFWDELCIAAAGPLCSLMTGVACLALDSLALSTAALRAFAAANLSLGFVNLLPILPLDGGRVLRALLLRCGDFSARFFRLISLILAAAFFTLSVFLFFQDIPNLVVMGGFLFANALAEMFRAGEQRLGLLFGGGPRLRSGEALRVRHVAVDAHTTLREAYAMTGAGRYTVWHVVDAGMRTLGMVDEGTLLVSIARMSGEAPLSALVDRPRGTC